VILVKVRLIGSKIVRFVVLFSTGRIVSFSVRFADKTLISLLISAIISSPYSNVTLRVDSSATIPNELRSIGIEKVSSLE
jgi:hypothetical protein